MDDSRSSHGSRLSRRRFLAALTGGAATALVAACSAPPAAPAPATQAPAKAAATAGPVGQVPTAAPVPTTAAAVKGGNLIMAFRNDMPTLDAPVPNSDFLNRLLTNTLLDPLVWQHQPGQFAPGLATSWEVSPDDKVYTFKLRNDVKFHDGTPFNAQAVKFTWDRIVDPATKALLVFLLGPYDRSEVVDDYTIRAYFKAPFPLFLNNLSRTGARPISPAAVQKWGKDYGQHAVGTGPFKLASWSATEIIFDRFDDYNWAPDFLNHKGPAYLDRITYRVVPEDATRMAGLEKGEALYVDSIPTTDVKRLQATSSMDIISLPGLPQIIQANVKQAPTDDKLVRQAVQYAVNHKQLVDVVFQGQRKPAYGVLSSTTPGYWKGVETLYPYSPDKAKQVLEQAGWKPGSDGIRVKDGKRLAMNYVTTATADITQTAEVFQSMLKEVGIDLKIEAMTNQASLARYQLGDYNFGRLGEQNPDPSVMSFPVHSRNITGGTQGNRSKYSDPEVDAKLDAAEQELDPAKRIKMYEELQQKVMDEAFIIGTFEQTLFFAANKNVQGLAYDFMGGHYFINYWLKK